MVKNSHLLSTLSLSLLLSSIPSAADLYPSVSYMSAEKSEFCLKTWKEKPTGGSDTERQKCFEENAQNTDELRRKISTLARVNRISNEKFWEIADSSTSLKDAYFKLGKSYPISKSCQTIERDYQDAIIQNTEDKKMLSCDGGALGTGIPASSK